jgi:hypothetical protein
METALELDRRAERGGRFGWTPDGTRAKRLHEAAR